MGQGGILATGSWDKTLKVQVIPLFPPNSIRFLCFYSFSQCTVTDAGKHAPNQVLGPPITRSACHRGTQGPMLCYGREERGARTRYCGPTRPNLQPFESNDAIQSWCLIPSLA